LIRPVLALSFSAAIVVLGFGIIMPFLPLYAQELGATTGLEIGFLSSAFLITRTFLATPMGSFSDRVGRKGMILVGLLIYSLLSVLFGMASSYFQLLLFRSLQGVASAMVWTPATALVADLTPPGRRGSAMGLYNSISMVGWMIGPAFGSGILWLVRNLWGISIAESYRIPFYMASLLSLVSFILVYLFVKVPAEAKPPKRPFMKLSLGGIDQKFKRTLYIVFFIVLVYGFATSFIEPLLVWFVQTEYSLSPEEISNAMGIIFSISGLIMIAVTLYAGRLADRFRKKTIIGISNSAAQALTMIMPFSGNIMNIGVVMSARSAAYAFSSPAYTALQQDLLPRRIRGALTGVFDTFFGIGSVLGPIVSFSLYDNVSHSSPFIVSGILGLMVVAILVLVKEPTSEEAQELDRAAETEDRHD
jgi:DHA1 family multidrug resistance protein-like MFS transporter